MPINPFNVSNLSRLERIDRSQDFGHAVSYLTLELPLKTIIAQDYFIGASIVHDEILSADNTYPLSSGYLYKTEFGKVGNKSVKITITKMGNEVVSVELEPH